MQHLSEEERGRIQQLLLKALEEALIQFQQATLTQRHAARMEYLQAIEDFTHFVSQTSSEVSAREICQPVA
jgi:hypothetical protein